MTGRDFQRVVLEVAKDHRIRYHSWFNFPRRPREMAIESSDLIPGDPLANKLYRRGFTITPSLNGEYVAIVKEEK